MTKYTKCKITSMDMMYYIKTISISEEQTDAFRLEAIITLLKLGGYVK